MRVRNFCKLSLTVLAACFLSGSFTLVGIAREKKAEKQALKILKTALKNAYQGRRVTMLRKGLDVSHCADLYQGRWNVLAVNEEIRGEKVSLNKDSPVGPVRGLAAIAGSFSRGSNSDLGCTGPLQVPVAVRDQLDVRKTDGWTNRDGTLSLELAVATANRVQQDRVLLGTPRSTLDYGYADWIFIVTETDTPETLMQVVNQWIRPLGKGEGP